jgi:hypothetical protein
MSSTEETKPVERDDDIVLPPLPADMRAVIDSYVGHRSAEELMAFVVALFQEAHSYGAMGPQRARMFSRLLADIGNFAEFCDAREYGPDSANMLADEVRSRCGLNTENMRMVARLLNERAEGDDAYRKDHKLGGDRF